MSSADGERFSALAWELLGGYIAENDDLVAIDLSCVHLTDAKMPFLFKNLTKSSSLEELVIRDNNFGLAGIRSMVPFLNNTQHLKRVFIGENDSVNTECFGLIMNALHGGSMWFLDFNRCNIGDITAIEERTLPHLTHLDLSRNDINTIPSLRNCANLESLYLGRNLIEDVTTLGENSLPCLQILELNDNNIQTLPSLEKHGRLKRLRLDANKIGKEGCRSVATLLRNKNSPLEELDLDYNEIDDDGAEILADSLKCNTALKVLGLDNNKLERKGYIAFLRLLNDVSSIETTLHSSNHTLTTLFPFTSYYSVDADIIEIRDRIRSATGLNESHKGNPGRAGGTKVVRTQLNIKERAELCRLQRVDSSYASLFAAIDPVLLPNVIALLGSRGWRDELYQMLVATAPAVTSLMDKKSMLEEAFDECEAMIAVLSAKRHDLKRRLDAINSKGGDRTTAREVGRSMTICGKKRSRRASL